MTVILGTFSNVPISAGTTESPAVAIQSGQHSLNVAMTRDAWPAAGADLELLASYNGSGGPWVSKAGPTHIAAFVPTAKEPTATPAEIGFGWAATDVQPTHAKGRCVSASSFTSTITLRDTTR